MPLSTMVSFEIPLFAYLAAPVIVGLTAHFSVEPFARRWHRTLRKSEWTPPPAAFPAVWLCNYLCLGYASFRVTKAGGTSLHAVGYVAHVLLLNAWNPVFFHSRRLGLALWIMGILIVTTPVLIWEAACRDLLAGLTLVPYYAWLLLMTHLSHFMWRNNPGPHFGAMKDEVIRQHEAAVCKAD